MMDAEKTNSRRAFGVILLWMGILFLLVAGSGYWGIGYVSQRLAALASAHPDISDLRTAAAGLTAAGIRFTYYGIPLIAAVFLLWSVLLWRTAGRRTSSSKPGPTRSPVAATDRQPDKDQQDKRLFVHLLSMFQREGRLLDFLSEDLNAYEDAQIGAAVRSIHENCNRVTAKYLSLEPVLDQEEGRTLTLQKGFDPLAVKLIGNVTGEPPFTGVIRHKGWKTGKLELPTLSAGQDPSVIAPAEVEII